MPRNIGELIGELIIFIVGIYVISEILKQLNIAFSSLFFAFFIILGVYLIIKAILE